MNTIIPEIFFYLFLQILALLFYSPAWAVKSNCDNKKIKLHKKADQLIQRIEEVEFCARPAAKFRDKVFSNLKYRSNRLKTCVQMVKQENLGFDCSREFRKTMKADGGENCAKQIQVMENLFKKFEILLPGYEDCLKIKD